MVLFGLAKFLCSVTTGLVISRWDLCHYKSSSLVVKEIILMYEGVSRNFCSVLTSENYESKHKGFVDDV